MNAYIACDRIEERRWVDQQLADEKDKWIDDRAKEIIATAPAHPSAFVSNSVPSVFRRALYQEKSSEAYNDFISALAYTQAEYEWEHRSGYPF
ncbi:host nuclease inhibitor GamL [Kosakonia radicincitans]|uniref:host nuclease inhibitor GamL n=1 Tax=Kosakonia radicincitans TaxID=283686 RepID=UPI001D0972B0|nr:host nuclease inhibitor GamL [Kosakonia radicincitans]